MTHSETGTAAVGAAAVRGGRNPASPRRSARASAPPWRNRIVGHADVPPAGLIANPANWRTHPAPQQRALAGALGEVGWVAQVLVNRRTGHLVDGHLRVELALARGEPSVPVTYVDLSEDEERMVLASLDPLGAMAGADAAKLEELLRDLVPSDDALGQMLAGLADQHSLMRAGLTDPDEVPPLPDEADIWVRPGELYRLGDHRLLCGDATSPADVARLLAGAEPTLLATDPPYGVSLDGSWRDAVSRTRGRAGQPGRQIEGPPQAQDAPGAPRGRRGRTVGHRNATLAGDTRADWSEAFELVPSIAVGYVWHAGIHAGEVARGLSRIGFVIVAQVIWDKGLFAMGRSWYHWAHEPCFVVRKAGLAVPFYGERNQATIWRVASPKMIAAGSREAGFDHPAQKPVVLFETPITNHLRAGEALYDPFAGSGTAIIAAERLGRRCYAIEIDPRYVQVALERWAAFGGREAVRLDG